MKIIKQLFTLAAIALLFTACNKNDELAPEQNSSFPADGIIRVATSVTAPKTRAGMTSADLDEFELHIVNDNNTAYSYTAKMVKEGAEWGSFEVYTDTDDNLIPLTLLWQNKTQPVNVSAVASGIFLTGLQWTGKCTLSVNNVQDPEIRMKECDILHMTEKVIDPSSNDLVNSKIPIVFNHRLSKLNLTVKMGTEFNKLEGGTTTNLISEMEVEGTNLYAMWTISEDNLSSHSSGAITPWHNAYIAGQGDTTQAEADYECILFPQTVAANIFEVSFTIGDRYFSWISPAEVVLEADTQYNLTLNVGHDVVTVNSFTATAWTVEEPQDIGTE